MEEESFDVREVHVMILTNYVGADSLGNNRFKDLAGRLANRGVKVELVTSDFSHAKLEKRTDFGKVDYDIVLVGEPGYKRNVSMTRLVSQYVFARRVGRYLEAKVQVPDLIICAVPPPELGRVGARYAQRAGVPFVVDIQDLWPEAFGLVLRRPKLINILFRRMRKSSLMAYRAADLIVGVSKTYVDSALRYIDIPKNSKVVHLGTNAKAFDEARSLGDLGATSQSKLPKLVYVGTLSHSYDLQLVMDALVVLRQRAPSYSELELMVLGDGPMRAIFENHAKTHDLNVTFHGRLAHADMVLEMCKCEIAVNPISMGSTGSVINKVSDYAAAGLAVVNTQESPEYRILLDQYKAGINCNPGDVYSVADAIECLVEDAATRLSMGVNNRKMADELFDRDASYESLVDDLLRLAIE